jgi:CRISPR-associated protein Cas1
VYDLQEPFRWIVDAAVMEAFESGVLDLPDFYFTGDHYRYRFEAEAKRRLLDFLRTRVNAGVKCNDQVLKWDTIIEQKTMELGRYLVGKSGKLSFSDPSPKLIRTDNRELRRRILGLSESEARRLGIIRSTFYQLRQKARSARSFLTYKKIESRLEPVQVGNHELPIAPSCAQEDMT